MTLKRIIIYGAGGFGRELSWLIDDINRVRPEWHVIGYFDDDPRKATAEINDAEFFAIGVGTPVARQTMAERLGGTTLAPATLVHPGAVIGSGVTLGDGSIVTAGVIIGPGARLGQHVALNVACGVGHDAAVGSFSVICPGARVSGGCQIGNAVLVGSNAVVAPLRSVGDHAVVGALSFVVTNVPSGKTAIGNPARVGSAVGR